LVKVALNTLTLTLKFRWKVWIVVYCCLFLFKGVKKMDEHVIRSVNKCCWFFFYLS
jgi:hypothetical protein